MINEEKQKALRLARKTARELAEQKAKQNVRGEKAAIKKGIPRIMMGTMKNRAEVSTNKLKSVHTEKAEKLQQDMQNIKSTLPLVSIVFITFPSLSRTYNVLVKSAVLVNRHHLVLSRYI